MPEYLGIDTSNYTTSAAIFNSDAYTVIQCRKILDVINGQKGLRQSDAVFAHVKQLAGVVNALNPHDSKISAIGVSVKPRNVPESYMPCFLCGEMLADSLSSVLNVPVFKTSHQVGHLLSALFSIGKLDFVKEKLIMFHVSGGTTECVLCMPNSQVLFDITVLGTSLDLKAGQLIDRVGVSLGLKFPCGKELEKLALKSKKHFNIRPVIKDCNCCLSGVENICLKMLQNDESYQDIAAYCIEYIAAALSEMTSRICLLYPDTNIIFAGGVMSNMHIRNQISSRFNNAFFASAEYSSDNAAGTAVYAALMRKGFSL